MTFQKTTLTITLVIFIILLAIFAYYIYKGQQKSKLNIISSTCPDYWQLMTDSNGNKVCSSDGMTNIGKCSNGSVIPNYTVKSDAKLCDKYKFTLDNCGGSIIWDGVTNNPLKDSCS